MNRLGQVSTVLIPKRSAKAVGTGTYRRRFRPLRSNLLTKGAYIGDGEPVRRGEIIWNENRTHNMGWSCMPGANAEVSYNRGFAPELVESAIYAQCDGTVRYTNEIFVPAPNTIEALKIQKMPRGAFMYKLHCHVVPERKESHTFKLKSFN